jgi:GRAS domain family
MRGRILDRPRFRARSASSDAWAFRIDCPAEACPLNRPGHPNGISFPPPPPRRSSWPVRDSAPSPRFTLEDLDAYLVAAAARTRRTPDFAAFFVGLGPVQRERLQRLWSAVRELEHGHHAAAAIEAEGLTRRMPDEEDGHDAVLVRTFAEALLGRIRNIGGGGNLYLGARPPGAQLRAFELLRLRTPLIPFGYAAANRALLTSIPARGDVTLLDLGIGRGGQICSLLKHPWAHRLFRSLRVIGVDPDSAPGLGGAGGALELAAINVLGTAADMGIPTTFAGIPKLAEDLTAADIAAASPQGLLLANGSLSLHHVGLTAHGARSSRGGVLALLHEAGCAHVVLLEPDSDHHGDDLTLRFLYAYRHYGTLLHSLYGTLPVSDALLVWSEFFAPEVRNVVTHDGASRVERHEEAEAWRERLAEAGFVIDTPAELVARAATPDGFDVSDDAPTSGTCTLSYGGVSLLGVLRAHR